jgi:dienelactone hydrolase
VPHAQQPFELDYPGEPGRIVRGRLVRPDGSRSGAALPWVLVLHGFKGFMDWGFFPELARRLADAGLAAVLFNTSGSGIGADLESFTEEAAFARGTLSRQLEDIARVREHVLSGAFDGLDLGRAGLFGHSRGGGMGLVHAAETGAYRAVVAWAAMDDADRYGGAVKAAWRRAGMLPVVNTRTGQVLGLSVEVLDDFERHRERFDIPAACARLAAPTLLLHGAEDESVDPAALDRLAAALPRGEAIRLPGAGHTFGATHPLGKPTPDLELALEKSVAWFLAHLLGGRQ